MIFVLFSFATADDKSPQSATPRFAILRISEPDLLTLRNQLSPGTTAITGLIGTAANEATNTSNAEALTKLFTQSKTSLVEPFLERLMKSFVDAKIPVVYLADQTIPPVPPGGKANYEGVVTNAAYLLDLRIVLAAYVSARKDADYVPAAWVRIAVIENKTYQRGFLKIATFGPGASAKSPLNLAVDGEVAIRYPSASALLADPAGAFEGITRAITHIGEFIPAKLP
jgi:hypothetical protein